MLAVSESPPAVEERLAALEASFAQHVDSTEDTPYRVSTLELALSDLVKVIRELVLLMRR